METQQFNSVLSCRSSAQSTRKTCAGTIGCRARCAGAVIDSGRPDVYGAFMHQAFFACMSSRKRVEAICNTNRQNAMQRQQQCSSRRSSAASIERRSQHQVQLPVGPTFGPSCVTQAVCTFCQQPTIVRCWSADVEAATNQAASSSQEEESEDDEATAAEKRWALLRWGRHQVQAFELDAGVHCTCCGWCCDHD